MAERDPATPVAFERGQRVLHHGRGWGTFHQLDHVHPGAEAWVSFGTDDPDDAVRVSLALLATGTERP